jgi:hypothetical protein
MARAVLKRFSFTFLASWLARPVHPASSPPTPTNTAAGDRNYENYERRVTCRRDRAHVVTWRYTFHDEYLHALD